MNAETPPAGHNQHSPTDRKRIINECVKEITTLESQRNQISEQIRDIKQTRIKGELGLKLSDFNIALRLYRLEGDDRDELINTMRECFAALGIGEQLDFIAAGERDSVPIDPDAARAAGEKAGLAGDDENPYSDDTQAYDEWRFGWDKGQAQLVTSMGNTESVTAS